MKILDKIVLAWVFILILVSMFKYANSAEYSEVIEYCNAVSDFYDAPREILPAIIRVESSFV